MPSRMILVHLAFFWPLKSPRYLVGSPLMAPSRTTSLLSTFWYVGITSRMLRELLALALLLSSAPPSVFRTRISADDSYFFGAVVYHTPPRMPPTATQKISSFRRCRTTCRNRTTSASA